MVLRGEEKGQNRKVKHHKSREVVRKKIAKCGARLESLYFMQKVTGLYHLECHCMQESEHLMVT